MKASSLQKILNEAKLGASIVIMFNDHTITPEATLAAEVMIDHFCKVGRIAVVHVDMAKSSATIAKTLSFRPQDAEEFASHIATTVSSAIARDIPQHTITLENKENRWQLRFEGGNKLLREFFKATCDIARTLFLFDASVLSDKEGATVIALSKGDEDTILQFSERIAEMFGVQLVL